MATLAPPAETAEAVVTQMEDAAAPQSPSNDGSKKRSAQEALGEGGATGGAEDTTPKKAKQEEPKEAANLSPEEKLVMLRKQIEYYLSDANMKTDRFFHNKISNDPDHFLDVQNILSCKKVQQLGVTKEDIFKALEGSHLETRPESEGKFAGVRRKEPLPPLEPGAGRRPFRPPFEKRPKVKVSKSSPTTPQNIHNLGCLLKVSDIPSEVSWTKIKEAIFKALEEVVPADVVPENKVQRKEPKNASGHPSYSKFIRFVSQVTPAAECLLYCRKFPDDKKYMESIKEIEIDGAKLGVSLVDNVDTAVNFFETQLSPLLKKERDREYNRAKCELLNKAIILGGTRFNNVDHLRKCYKELLEVTPLGTEVKPAAFTVLRALLEYHPRAAEKCRDIVSIKVCKRDDVPDNKLGRNRCFFLVRSDGSSEDFSTNKCMDNLSINPPLAPPKASTPKKEQAGTDAAPIADTASPSTSSTAEDTPSQKTSTEAAPSSS